MSDENRDAKFNAEDLKAAVLAVAQPEEILDGGKVGAAFDLDGFKALVAKVDQVVGPLAPVVASLTPPQFSAVVLALAAALHAASGQFPGPAQSHAHAPEQGTVVA